MIQGVISNKLLDINGFYPNLLTECVKNVAKIQFEIS